jgi:hypothetical protein
MKESAELWSKINAQRKWRFNNRVFVDARLGQVEAIVDAVTGEPTQVIFSFRFGHETPLTGEFEIMSVGVIDMTFP